MTYQMPSVFNADTKCYIAFDLLSGLADIDAGDCVNRDQLDRSIVDAIDAISEFYFGVRDMEETASALHNLGDEIHILAACLNRDDAEASKVEVDTAVCSDVVRSNGVDELLRTSHELVTTPAAMNEIADKLAGYVCELDEILELKERDIPAVWVDMRTEVAIIRNRLEHMVNEIRD